MSMKILVVDDQQCVRMTISRFLESEQLVTLSAENGMSAKRILENEIVAAVVTDVSMPGMDGLELLEWIREEGPEVPVIMMPAVGDVADAVEAMRLGADDYLVKPFSPEELIIRLNRMIENQHLKEQIEAGQHRHPSLENWIGESREMVAIKALVSKIAPTPSTVLITGESGTGKDVAAQAIHDLSARVDEPFIAINIGGIPDTLLEAELFGHEKGAFTGALTRKIGMFEYASSGTLLLDEIGEMPLHLQVKLLKVFRDRKIQRLGGTQRIPVNVRILAATKKKPEVLVQEHGLHEDLYHSLNIIQLRIPPLRERPSDIPLLAGYFITQCNNRLGKNISGITPEAILALQSYAFPGNVRELENLIERAVILSNTGMITLRELEIVPTQPHNSAIPRDTLENIQKQAILDALRRWDGNRTRAAKELGINRRTIQKKLKQYGFENI